MESIKKIGGLFKDGYGWLNWPRARDISIFLLMIVGAYRLAVSRVEIDLSGFSFTDILSMVLAIFAIALSAAFYFKADESSKTFYDNSLKFTSHMSETLGRIEERFGESLKNIHEGQSGLSRKFDSFPFDLKEAREGKQREEDAVVAREAEYKQALDELMQKAHLADGEKEELRDRLTSIAKELETSKAELARYKTTIQVANSIFDMSDELFSWLMNFVRANYKKSDADVPLHAIARKFNVAIENGLIPNSLMSEAVSLGVIQDDRLTLNGAKQLRDFISSFFG
ncbi:hypothetical protein ACT2UN_000881 [Pseudomonas putida]